MEGRRQKEKEVEYLLLVEGVGDEHVVKHICGHFKLGMIEKIEPLGGIEKLLNNVPVRVKGSGIKVIGIVLDADEDPVGRWQSVTDRLKNKGYCDIDNSPAADGAIILPPAGPNLLPKVGIWMMPNNQDKGYLEDFLQCLIKQDDQLHAHAKKHH